jgi:hypothetical protein
MAAGYHPDGVAVNLGTASTATRPQIERAGKITAVGRYLAIGPRRNPSVPRSAPPKNWPPIGPGYVQNHNLLKLRSKSATPAGFEPEEEPNRFADLHSSGERLGVPLGSGEIAWKHQNAVRLGPAWALDG